MSLYSKVAPLRIISLMMAVNFLPNFLGGGFLQGWLGHLLGRDGQSAFLPDDRRHRLPSRASIIWAMERPLRPFLQKSHD